MKTFVSNKKIDKNENISESINSSNIFNETNDDNLIELDTNVFSNKKLDEILDDEEYNNPSCFEKELKWVSQEKKYVLEENVNTQLTNLNLFQEGCLLYFSRNFSPLTKVPLIKLKDKLKWVDNSLNLINHPKKYLFFLYNF